MNSSLGEKGPLQNWRLLVIYGLMVIVFGYYVYKLFSLQVLQGAEFQGRADINRTDETNVPTQRGIIFDRNGFVLARNVASYNVTIVPAYLPDDPSAQGDYTALTTGLPATVQEVYRKLSLMIDVAASKGELNNDVVRLFKPCNTDLGIAQIVYIADTNAPYSPMRIKCNISEELAMTIRSREAEMPGVGIEIEAVRDYPTGALTAALIGFLGPVPANEEDYYRAKGFVPGRDKVGYAGVEATMQDVLGGKNGKRTVEVDVSGKEMRNLTTPIDPVAGNNIQLTIDTRLQSIAQEAITGELAYWKTRLGKELATNAVAIAINPKTGEILAMVSYPSYENNRMARQIPADYYQQLTTDPRKPLFNQAISAEHPPGSVFKLPTAIGALNERVVTPEQQLNDPGRITLIQKALPNSVGVPIDLVCWERTGHGEQDWLQGVANSCDVYFYKIGGGYAPDNVSGLGIWRLDEYARALGYGARSGIELPGEATGLIPSPDWKRVNQGESWTTGDTYIASMGQGYILATPLQVLLSSAVLGNNGRFMQPTIVREVYSSEGSVVKPFQPQLKWDITKDPVIKVYDQDNLDTGKTKVVDAWVVQMAKQAMRLVVTDGTGKGVWTGSQITNSAGKTGTAEYCDDIANKKGLCQRGNWPTHSWYFGYAPFDDPEIAVVAFVYNGGEGASVAAPIVRQIIEGYYQLKSIDAEKKTGPQP
jgi:penicillin-binding protein 2